MKTLTAKSKGETVQETEKSKKNPKKNPKKEQPAPTAEPSPGSATDPAPKAKDAGGILCEATEGVPPKKKLKGGYRNRHIPAGQAQVDQVILPP